jgi:hypothetical protein
MSARSPDDLDVIRDALGLVEAAHHEDMEGAQAILGNGNTRLIAAFLSRVCADLIEDLTDDASDTLGWLREQHAAG